MYENENGTRADIPTRPFVSSISTAIWWLVSLRQPHVVAVSVSPEMVDDVTH